jgi:hypothetical protein
MSVSRGWFRPGWLRLTPLALGVLAACLNPQPDDHPLNRDPGDNDVASQGDPGAQAPPPNLMTDEAPASSPPPSPIGSSGGDIADAGAPPAAADGGPGDPAEGDAGPD